MKIVIKENEQTYNMNQVNWATLENGELTINYVDENGEIHEVFGKVPKKVSISFNCI